MLAPYIPLRMMAQYTPPQFPGTGATIEEKRKAIELALANCRITRDVGTDQMNIVKDAELKEDICNMRVAALLAISAAEKALKAKLEDFDDAEREFRELYGNLIRSVKSFLWDAGPVIRQTLWPLVEDLM